MENTPIEIVKETSPHLRRKDSLNRMLADVLIALAPVAIMSLVAYGFAAARNLAVSIVTMVLCEFIYVMIRGRIPYDGKKHTFKEQWKAGLSKWRLSNLLAPLVSAIIFALIMPAKTDNPAIIYVALITGSIVGIVLAKLVFGGTGSNIFNPAAVGMVFAKVCFGSHWVYENNHYVTTVVAGGTPLGAYAESFLAVNNYNLLDLFLGNVPGTIGEGFKIAILVGLIYLLWRKAADWRVVVSYFASFLVMVAFAGMVVCLHLPKVNFFRFIGFHLLTGGVIFGATYMFTDPVTMPINSPGRVIYGLLGGVLTCIIRFFAPLPEGVVYAILLSNMMAPVIDYYKWSSQKWTIRKAVWCCGILAVGVLVTCLGIHFGKF